MIKRILVLLDPTPATTEADETAIRFAQAAGVDLTGLAIADVKARRDATVPMGIGTSGLARDAREQAVRDEIREAHESAEDFRARCSAQGIIPAVLDLQAETVPEILAESFDHDLVLLASGTVPGEMECEELVFELMDKGSRPVLVVGKGRGDSTPGTVLAALDGHPQSWRSLHSFLQLMPPALVKRLVLLSLIANDRDEPLAHDRLERGLRLAEAYGFTSETLLLCKGDPAEAIEAVATQVGADTILLGPYSKPAIHRLFFGSVTSRLLAQTDLSVFLDH
jgi:nucleotide-binding universal stress UspA family protein